VTKGELIDYGREVAHQTSHFFRPNFWVNTPDILPFHLQSGEKNIFAIRALLASTMAPSWGMYAGYELFESQPVAEGKEEYLDSEKYEIKIRDWDEASKKGLSLAPYITRLNEIRRSHPALTRLRNLHFHPTDSDSVIAYSKREGDDLVFVVVNLDPKNPVETTIHWELWVLGFEAESFDLIDQLDQSAHTFTPHNRLRLDPNLIHPKSAGYNVGRILTLKDPSILSRSKK
jgi:starch synthase (maltosyl-transferring)